MGTIFCYKETPGLKMLFFLLSAPKEHKCRLDSQGLWREVISFMRPSIRVGEKIHKQSSHS